MPFSAFARNRNTIPMPKNPMDKCTIVSIYPKHIVEKKPTIQPSRFEIQPGTYDNPSILVVGSSSWWKEVDENQPLVEIPNGSVQVAESFINDYCNGLLGCNMTDAMPGLFYVFGELTVAQIQKDHKVKLISARSKQIKFYEFLVRLSDIGWSRTNGNPAAISDESRFAARELGLTDRGWMKVQTPQSQEKCPACGAPYNPEFPMCGNCKTIVNQKLFEQRVQATV